MGYGVGNTGCPIHGWRSARSWFTVQHTVRNGAKITSPGQAWCDGSCSHHKITVQRASRRQSGGQELIAAVTRAPRDSICDVVVQQTSVAGGREARLRVPEILKLRRVSDGGKSGKVGCFCHRNGADPRGGRRFIGRHPRAKQVRNRNRRDREQDRDHDK